MIMSDAPTSGGDEPPLRALIAAGWTSDDLEWESLQAEGLTALVEERGQDAALAWAAALELAHACLKANDPRLATSLANQATGLAQAGETELAGSMLVEALLVWDSAGPWIEALKPTQRSRSSTFHLRLESKHQGGYVHFERERHELLAKEGRALLSAMRADNKPESDAAARLARWQNERPEGFTDGRKLLAAVLLIAG